MVKKVMRVSYGVCPRFLIPRSGFLVPVYEADLNTAMDPSAGRDSRSEALLRAKKHNLDVALIARETVRLCLEEVVAVGSYIFFSWRTMINLSPLYRTLPRGFSLNPILFPFLSV